MEKYDNIKINTEQAKELLDIYNALTLLRHNDYLTECEFSQKIERYAYECSGKIAIVLKDKKCGNCLYFNGDMRDEQAQFCDIKEVYVSKSDYCSEYKEDSEKIEIKE